MRKNLIIILLFFVICEVHSANVNDFKLKNLENERKSYSELKGEKLTILDFWATWCKPCLKAIPKLIKLYEEFSGQGVEVIGISVDSPRNVQKVKPFAKSLGINYPVLLDLNGEVMTKLNVSVMPTLLLVDSTDQIVLVHQGYRPGDEKYLEEEIKKILQKEKNDHPE